MRLPFFIMFILGLSLLLGACRSPVEPQERDIFALEIYYTCESRNLIKQCLEGLSSTGKTCYELNSLGIKVGTRCFEGWKKVVPTPPTRECGDYHCYPGKDYCRLHGLFTNPEVPRKEACGTG